MPVDEKEIARGMTKFNPVTMIPLGAQRINEGLQELLRMLGLTGGQQPAPPIDQPLPRFGGLDEQGNPIVIPPDRRRY
jgi:hypothetical protein